MAKRMLIDATHREETRVVVLNGNRLDEFDFETSTKKQLKGNIYLAKVTRVEPSLQAAFVDFGGNRHGFLAFNEIHPDYYQIPVADRMALLKEEEALAAEDLEAGAGVDEDELGHPHHEILDKASATAEENAPVIETDGEPEAVTQEADGEPESVGGESAPEAHDAAAEDAPETDDEEAAAAASGASGALEEVGGEDTVDIQAPAHRRPRPRRQRYKIQEVIKRRQIILVQVVKEERGNKGAALTTYLSLAGRYCVLMPNTTKGGGISRKITSPKDRNRLKGFISDLEIPDGVAVILRTAAIERSKAEIRRDFEYLIRTWHQVRDTTLQSIAPTLVYEEGNLIKRSIRDLYSKDMDDVLVEGDEGYKTAKDFMRMLMPSHAKRVQPYKDESIPLFQRYQVEPQIDAMHSPEVKLKSGGYIVINPTEALVSIDVNSGRATRERNIEETAYKTNLEAAEEIARQLKLRDLAGLIVIDFIDMMENRNQHTVERRLKDAMRSDRARIQIGRISPFGLLELSRQRLRPSLLEASTAVCPHCEGTGLIRSKESAALHVLRAVEEEGIRRRSGEIHVAVATPVALYILNEKRDMLTGMEGRHGFRVFVTGDDSLVPPAYQLDRVAEKPAEPAAARAIQPETSAPERDEVEDEDEAKPSRRRRSRRRRGRRNEEAESETVQAQGTQGASDADEETPSEESREPAEAEAADADEQTAKPKRRRRGRRGGRRQSRAKNEAEAAKDAGAETAESQDARDAAGGEVSENMETPLKAGDEDGKNDAAPKSRARRSRAKAADTATDSTGADADGEDAADAAEASGAAADGEKAKTPRPRKRRSRARKPADKDTGSAPEPPEPKAEQAAVNQGNGANGGAPAGSNGSSASGPAPAAAERDRDPGTPAKSESGAEESPPPSKRQGWWNRFTQSS
ncbi:MAG: ribonuclease E/G [Alphaproteobacteria bacterium]|nr:ribonuclease E/G [Alphaproteobacteria bacterium]